MAVVQLPRANRTVSLVPIAVTLLAAVVALFSGCAGSPDPAPQASEEAEIAAEVAKEEEVGEAAFAKLAGQYGIVRDEAATAYLNKYLQSLALYVERQELSYRAAILDTEQINAFALPGGYILVTLGTLQQLSSPGELAGVLAHELGHVQHKHILDNVTIEVEYSFAETLARVLAGGRGVVNTAMAQINDAIEERLFLEGYQAEDEYEADAYAVALLQSLGMSATPYHGFLRRLSEEGPEAGASLENLDATHPPLSERLRRIEPLLAEEELREPGATEEFAAFMRTVASLQVATTEEINL